MTCPAGVPGCDGKPDAAATDLDPLDGQRDDVAGRYAPPTEEAWRAEVAHRRHVERVAFAMKAEVAELRAERDTLLVTRTDLRAKLAEAEQRAADAERELGSPHESMRLEGEAKLVARAEAAEKELREEQQAVRDAELRHADTRWKLKDAEKRAAAAEAACRVKDAAVSYALGAFEVVVRHRRLSEGGEQDGNLIHCEDAVSRLRAALSTPPADALRAEINAFMDAVRDVLDEWDVEPRSEFGRAMTEAFIKRYG